MVLFFRLKIQYGQFGSLEAAFANPFVSNCFCKFCLKCCHLISWDRFNLSLERSLDFLWKSCILLLVACFGLRGLLLRGFFLDWLSDLFLNSFKPFGMPNWRLSSLFLLLLHMSVTWFAFRKAGLEASWRGLHSFCRFRPFFFGSRLAWLCLGFSFFTTLLR